MGLSNPSGAPLNSPAFTGVPTAPTATSGTNTIQLATTAFVQTAISGFSGVLTTVLTGLSTATSTAITASDTVLSAFGKLQAQITGLTSSTIPNSGGINSIVALTQTQYNAIGTPSATTLYIITGP